MPFLERCLREAARLARLDGTQITLFHSHQYAEVAVMDFVYVDPPERVAAVCKAAETRLEEWAKEMELRPGTFAVKVVTGSPVIVLLTGFHLAMNWETVHSSLVPVRGSLTEIT